LGVHEAPDDELHLALRLHVAPDAPEGHFGVASPGDETRHDRVERALAATDARRVRRIEAKTHSAVVQADPGPGDDHPRAESQVVRLNERDQRPAASTVVT
jgi:hypothetical protein